MTWPSRWDMSRVADFLRIIMVSLFTIIINCICYILFFYLGLWPGLCRSHKDFRKIYRFCWITLISNLQSDLYYQLRLGISNLNRLVSSQYRFWVNFHPSSHPLFWNLNLGFDILWREKLKRNFIYRFMVFILEIWIK